MAHLLLERSAFSQLGSSPFLPLRVPNRRRDLKPDRCKRFSKSNLSDISNFSKWSLTVLKWLESFKEDLESDGLVEAGKRLAHKYVDNIDFRHLT